jgi:hypothetical protein
MDEPFPNAPFRDREGQTACFGPDPPHDHERGGDEPFPNAPFHDREGQTACFGPDPPHDHERGGRSVRPAALGTSAADPIRPASRGSARAPPSRFARQAADRYERRERASSYPFMITASMITVFGHSFGAHPQSEHQDRDLGRDRRPTDVKIASSGGKVESIQLSSQLHFSPEFAILNGRRGSHASGQGCRVRRRSRRSRVPTYGRDRRPQPSGSGSPAGRTSRRRSLRRCSRSRAAGCRRRSDRW